MVFSGSRMPRFPGGVKNCIEGQKFTARASSSQYNSIDLLVKIVNTIGRSRPESVFAATIFVDIGGALFL
jgi:hypothetical protein